MVPQLMSLFFHPLADGHHIVSTPWSFEYAPQLDSFGEYKAFIHKTFKLFIMSNGKIVLGVLAGIAAGTLLGVLIAPDKGAETRRKIRQKGDDLVEGVRDGMTSMVDDVASKFDKLRGKARKTMNEALAGTDNYEHADL
jgi:gas vesicle protein